MFVITIPRFSGSNIMFNINFTTSKTTVYFETRKQLLNSFLNKMDFDKFSSIDREQ